MFISDFAIKRPIITVVTMIALVVFGLASLIQLDTRVLIFSVVVVGVHCFYGYRASGGPAGVGVAVGRAVRASIVMINIIDFFLSLAIWGATTTVRVAG